MKKILLTFMISLGALFANAQLSFTRSDFTQAPAKFRYKVDKNFVLPNVYATGSNLTWDFTKAQEMDELVTIFHVSSTTPDFNLFPNSEIALQRDSSIDVLYYIKDGNDSVVVIGSTDPNLPNLHFRTLVFPLELNTNWSDKGSRFVKAKGSDYGYPQADSVKVTVKYEVINKAEGEGKLKLASGELDALKLSTINKITFDAQVKVGIWIPLPAGTFPDIIDTTYSFFSKNYGYAVVSMESNNDGSFLVNHQELSGGNSSVNSINGQNKKLEVYPNPANNYLNVSFKHANTYKITDMIGRKIISGNIENTTVDISALMIGNYIIHVYKGNEIIGVQKFVKQ